ncbi:YoaK family protein [Streptomyces rubellomurinus]|uniref:Membrane protein n=1 Tax=Streptomyces rubellomurinus (strain ATCC 31215) TaxID=359131 RepID=A0A0F2TKA3_STRR3|nr:YoaK family protein [Streptomyces rubellomurinus]KJS62152.1 membrane protein [Streptomyces rubellomurinus]
MLTPDPKHGPLVPMLLALTVVTGVVDAVSYLELGHVFVANMTGNVVFLGFALAGAAGLSATASLAALAAFLLGALAGGHLARRLPGHRGRLLTAAVTAQAVLVAASTVLAAVAGHSAEGVRYTLIGLLGFAMGGQNAVVRALKVPDLTTTVLTMTITALAADRTGVRRLASAVWMFAGALLGALLVLHTSVPVALALALALLTGVAALTRRASRPFPAPAWTDPV